LTTPKIQTISRSGSRFYVNPVTNDKVPGVTSILSMLPKPFLQHWAAKMVAEFAVDNFGAYSALIMNGQRQAAIDLLKAAPRRYTTGRADIGTEVHDAFDRLSKGETLGRVTADAEPYLKHFDQFVKDFQPTFLMTEETIFSDKHRYAGTFDWIAEIGGEVVVGDWKTTKATYAEVGLQLAAYRYADYVQRTDGNQVPLPKNISGGAVFHMSPEHYELIPMKCDEEVFDVFLALRNTVFEWDKTISKTVIGKPLTPIFKGA
jgi:hypothetical protein